MPLQTRSRKVRASPSNRPSGEETISLPNSNVAKTPKGSDMSTDVDPTNEEKKDFQPPPPCTSSTPVSSKRQLTPSAGRKSKSRLAPDDLCCQRISSTREENAQPSESSARWQPTVQARRSPFVGGRPSPVQRRGNAVASSFPGYTPGMNTQDPTKTRHHRSQRAGMESEDKQRGELGPSTEVGSIAAELDLEAKVPDDFGPSVADCLNLGSFGDDAPSGRGRADEPKKEKVRTKVNNRSRVSKRHKSLPSKISSCDGPEPQLYVPNSGAPHPSYQPGMPYHPKGVADDPQASPPHFVLGYQESGLYAYPSQYPPLRGAAPAMGAPPESWTAPQGIDHRRPAEFDQGTSCKRRNSKASPASKPHGWEVDHITSHGTSSTPRASPNKNASDGTNFLPARSPFRSPISNMDRSGAHSNKKHKRSPLFGGSTPNIGSYGSFGMDTPGATLDGAKLDEFSPMGPSFPDEFGDETAPFSIAGEGGDVSDIHFDPKLNLNRMASGEGVSSRKKTYIRQRRGGELTGSPFSSFLGSMSPLSGDIRLQGSPFEVSGRHDYLTRYAAEQDFNPMGSPHLERQFPSSCNSTTAGRFPQSHKGSMKTNVLTSPVASSTGHKTKQKKPWFDVSRSPGPVRLELGSVGMKPVETRKSLEGINSMVRGTSLKSEKRRGFATPPTFGTTFGKDLSTPIKVNPVSTPSANRTSKPSSMQGFSGLGPGKRTPNSVGPNIFPHIPTSAGGRPFHTPGKSPSSGKENDSPKATRRHPCNCKKSKCLKLYCECFAAELFCDKCNCSDCRNSPAYEAIREKAIKETKAKNPNAFKPRIAVRPGAGPKGSSPPSGHNMGCRCKRSECLKKYCECFQAGVMCGSKCKCVDCLNYVGSQPLIDKRRKIKDHKGAEFAMRTADDAWKGKSGPGAVHPMGAPSPAGNLPHTVGHPLHPGMPPMIQPSPGPNGNGHGAGPAPAFGMAPYAMGPPIGYSPMGMPHTVTPGYAAGKPPHGGLRQAGIGATKSKTNSKHQRPTSTPRSPAKRLGFNPLPRKKRKHNSDQQEEICEFFGPKNGSQPRSLALAVFNFLSNDDLYNAGIVCKRWSRLALDDELWQF